MIDAQRPDRDQSLEVELLDCRALAAVDSVAAMQTLLHRLAMTPLRCTSSPDGRLIYVADQAAVSEQLSGALLTAEVRHPLLAVGSAGADVLKPGRRFSLSHDASFIDYGRVDPAAAALLRLSEVLYTQLQPTYGIVDERSLDVPTDEEIVGLELRRLFWANFFGPAYVERYGAEFLLAAPGWRTKQLADGGIIYVVTEHFTTLDHVLPAEPLAYFRQQVPDIRWQKRGMPDY